MKTLKLLLFYLAVFFAALFFTRCSLTEDIAKITDALDSLKVSAGTPRFNTGVNIVFVDVKTKQLINSKQISVSVNGKDASSIYNNIGAKESPYIRKWGMLDLIVDPHKVDSSTIKENPLYFNISATSAGYVSVDKAILISEIGKKRVVVEMINEQNPPEGVLIQKFENVFTTGNDGRVTKSSTLNVFSTTISNAANGRANASPSVDALFTIEIPEGIILKGIDNEPLVGQAVISVMYTEFSPHNQSYDPFKIVRNYNSTNYFKFDQWYFPFSNRTVYIWIIDKNKNWNTVAKIGNGDLKLTTAIPTTFYNREKKKYIAENDIIERTHPYMDWNDYVVKWDVVAKDTVKKADDKFYIIEKINNVNQFYSYWGYVKPVCFSWPYYNFVGDFKTNPNFLIDIYSDDYKVDSYNGPGVIFSETKRGVGIGILPSGTTKHVFSNSEQNEDVVLEYTPSEIINNCEAKEYNISVKETIKPGVEFIKLNFDLSVSSKSSQIVFMPNLEMYINKENSILIANQHELINGKASFSVVVGTKYKIWLGFYSWMGDARLLVEKDGADKYKVTISTMKFSEDGTSNSTGEFIFLPKKNKDGSIDVRYNAEIPEDLYSTLGF